VALGDELEALRLVKTAAEVAAIETAARFNAEAFAEVEALIRPGACERDLALALEFALKRRGAEEKAFDFIVASGPRGALPHGVASDRRLVAGELVTLDFGCRVDGYHADETVTLAVGAVADRLRRVFDTVLHAHDLALAAVAPGVPWSSSTGWHARRLAWPATVTILAMASVTVLVSRSMKPRPCRRAARLWPRRGWCSPLSRESTFPEPAVQGSRIRCWSRPLACAC